MLPAFLADVSVTTGEVPPLEEKDTQKGVLWQACPGKFRMDVPDIARYLVTDGHAVRIEPAPNALSITVEQFFRMTPLGAVVYQRGLLPLHATAICKGTGAVVLAGDSGVGKSTLAAELLLRGWKLLGDDIALIDLAPANEITAHSTFDGLALWPDSVKKLGLAAGEASCDSSRRMWSPPGSFEPEEKIVRAIFYLGVYGKEAVDLSDIRGAAKFRAPLELSYNSHIADALLDKASYMRIGTVISQCIPIYRLLRPRGAWCASELADIVERTIS